MEKRVKAAMLFCIAFGLTLVGGSGMALAANLYSSTDVPKTIAGPAPVLSEVSVPSPHLIADIDVKLDISHPCVADLDIFLIAPDGARVELSTDNGDCGSNYNGTIFDDEAATSITSGSAPFIGSYRPETLLSALDHKAAGGTWILEITDDKPLIDNGTLHNWTLKIATVAAPYRLSTYASGLPSNPAGLTVDPRTRTLYYADSGVGEGVLRKITADGSVSVVSSDFTPDSGSNFYPFASTDIQFLDGSVYVSLADGELARIDTRTGISTIEHIFTGFSLESGITAKGSELLVTSGRGLAKEIQSYNYKSTTASPLLNVPSLLNIMNVKYNDVNKKIYFSEQHGGTFRFYQADYGGSAFSLLLPCCYLSGRADFEITPDGEYHVGVNFPKIVLLSLDDGLVTTLYNDLTSISRHDMVFAPSSKSGGCSLFVVDGTSILEISGFTGNCGKPFSWPMVLPAIIGNSQE